MKTLKLIKKYRVNWEPLTPVLMFDVLGWNMPGWKPLKKGIYDSSRRFFVLKTFCEVKIFIASADIKKEKLMNRAPAFVVRTKCIRDWEWTLVKVAKILISSHFWPLDNVSNKFWGTSVITENWLKPKTNHHSKV